MTNFTQTFQTAGYVQPFAYITSESVITGSAQCWKAIGEINPASRSANDSYDHFKTDIHSLMHNRAHQSEY